MMTTVSTVVGSRWRSPMVVPADIPSDAHVLRGMPVIDWSDACQVTLPPGVPNDADFWRRRIFGPHPTRHSPTLLEVRDRIAGMLGLRAALPAGDSPGAFPVHFCSRDEVVVGIDDRHLDFRVGILIRHSSDGAVMVLATVVRRHNALGRQYFRVVRPFHRIIVPRVMRRAVRGVYPRALPDDSAAAPSERADEAAT